jgi:hypothetical protein
VRTAISTESIILGERALRRLCHSEEGASPPRDPTIGVQRRKRSTGNAQVGLARRLPIHAIRAFGPRKVPHADCVAVQDDKGGWLRKSAATAFDSVD